MFDIQKSILDNLYNPEIQELTDAFLALKIMSHATIQPTIRVRGARYRGDL